MGTPASPPSPSPSPLDVETTDALAKRWGVSRATLYRWRRRRRRPLPAISFGGGKILRPVALVERWLAEQAGVMPPRMPAKARKAAAR